MAGIVACKVADELGVGADFVVPAYEDEEYWAKKLAELPANVTTDDSKLDDIEARERMKRLNEHAKQHAQSYADRHGLPVGR